MAEIKFKLNGKETVVTKPDWSLLRYLREELNLVGAKKRLQ